MEINSITISTSGKKTTVKVFSSEGGNHRHMNIDADKLSGKTKKAAMDLLSEVVALIPEEKPTIKKKKSK